MRYTCSCKRFAIKPQTFDRERASEAALSFASRHLPDPDPWAQDRTVQYTVQVTDEAGETAEVVVHAYYTVQWGLGKID